MGPRRDKVPATPRARGSRHVFRYLFVGAVSFFMGANISLLRSISCNLSEQQESSLSQWMEAYIHPGLATLKETYDAYTGKSVDFYNSKNPTLPIIPLVGPNTVFQNADDLPHPHAGARHADGTLGLVVNPSPLRMGPRFGDRPYACPKPGVGAEGNHTYLAIQIVRRGLQESRAFLKEKKMAGEHIPRILCMVYTYSGGHDRVQAIVNTWARECDGFIAFSNATNHSLGAIDLLHRGPEIYGNMWQKIRSMWAYVYDYYVDHFDYFHICGDDTYVILDKMRAFLMGPEVERLKQGYRDRWFMNRSLAGNQTGESRPLILGDQMYSTKTGLFVWGGPGYTLNRAAVRLFAEQGLPHYKVNETTSWEDVLITKLFNSKGVYVSVTSESPPNTAKRYIAGIHFLSKGLKDVSSQTVSFHLKVHKNKVEAMYRHHELLNHNATCAVE